MRVLAEFGLLFAARNEANLEGIAFLGWICVVLALLAIPAMLLGTACKIARVQPPEFFGAMGIVLVAGLAVFTVDLMFACVIALGKGAFNISSLKDLFALLESSAPFIGLLHPFIVAAVYSTMLQECSYLRALLIWVLQLVVVVVFLLLFGLVAYFFMQMPNRSR